MKFPAYLLMALLLTVGCGEQKNTVLPIDKIRARNRQLQNTRTDLEKLFQREIILTDQEFKKLDTLDIDSPSFCYKLASTLSRIQGLASFYKIEVDRWRWTKEDKELLKKRLALIERSQGFNFCDPDDLNAKDGNYLNSELNNIEDAAAAIIKDLID